MAGQRKNWSAVLLVIALVLGSLGIALQAADEEKATTPRDVLDPLLESSEWGPQWVEEAQAYQVVFKGPDVWVRLSGEFVSVQSYLGRVPQEVSANALISLLRRNRDLYEGKFGIDKEMDLWFEINTHQRILDGVQLSQQIAVVADAAAHASELVKTQIPETSPQP